MFPFISHASTNGEILVVEIVVSKTDQKFALEDDSTEFHQLPAKVDLATAEVLPPSMSSPTARVVLPGEADNIRSPLETFYKVYSGVSPRTRLL